MNAAALAGPLVPAGLLVGIGAGLVNGEMVASILIGLGVGLGLMAVVQTIGR